MQHAKKDDRKKGVPMEDVRFRLRCTLGVSFWPAGNPLPMVLPIASEMQQQQQQQQQPQTTGITYTGEPILQLMGKTIVDAHNVNGVNIDQAIEGVSKAMSIAMPMEELCLRRQLADKLMITMGNGMTHYEADVDQSTGTFKVDCVFSPNIVDKNREEHLEHLHEYDPAKGIFKVRDHAILRLYTTQVDAETGRKFPYLISSQAIDLKKLQERSIQVTEAAIRCSQQAAATASVTAGESTSLHEQRAEGADNRENPSSILTSCDHDFAMMHNFCKSFALVRVMPFVGQVVCASSEADAKQRHAVQPAKHAFEVHKGLYVAHSLTQEAMLEELHSMKSELKRMQDGIAAFEAHKQKQQQQQRCEKAGSSSANKEVDMSNHVFVSSILSKVPYIQSMVKLQQGLQQAYCMNSVQTANALLSEPNSMQFASGATFLQTHQMSINFATMTQVHNDREPPIPRPQLLLQTWAAMTKASLDFKEVSQWKASTHAKEIGSLISGIISMSNMDQVQSQYQYDMVVQSVMPVPECVAKANLQPVPGSIEYAPGCMACFYKKHNIRNFATGEDHPQYFRYNLAVSEDLCQLRAGYDLCSYTQKIDCEDDAQHAETVAKAFMKLKRDLKNMSNTPLDQIISERFFGKADNPENIQFIQAVNNLCEQVKLLRCVSNTANAMAAQMGMAGNSYTGHAYGTFEAHLNAEDPVTKEPIIVRGIAEGTKWVEPYIAGVVTSTSRNAGLTTMELQMANQLSQVAEEITKITTVDPKDDRGAAPLMVTADKGTPFYANLYIHGNCFMWHQSVPGVPSSPLAMGVPLAYVLFNASTMVPKPIEYNLVEKQLMAAGCQVVRPLEIKDMVKEMYTEEAVNTWRTEEYEKNVYRTYLPCTKLYDDPQLAKSYDPDKHCVISFTHQVDSKKTPMTMETARQFCQNIINIINHAHAPPITEVHKVRLTTCGLPPKMPQQYIDQIKPFDVHACNASAKSVLGNGWIKVERVATCMGSVMTTCVVEKAHLQKLCEGMVNWVKPIVEASAVKSAACIAWRKQLEAQHAVSPQIQMAQGAMGSGHGGRVVISKRQLRELLMKQGQPLPSGSGAPECGEEIDGDNIEGGNTEKTGMQLFTEEEVGKMMHVGNLFVGDSTGQKNEQGQEETSGLVDITHLVRRLEHAEKSPSAPTSSQVETEDSMFAPPSASRMLLRRR